MNEKTYNGWTNYETWLVALWLDNEPGTYGYWREQAREHRKSAPNCWQVRERIWMPDRAAVFNLADQLKEEMEDANPLSESSLFSDLLTAALCEVDWQEIAEHYLADLEDEEPERLEAAANDDE